ncbi:undecaprenyl/decaprenyl-phosphate alpha-N-acetylglucosaminyl 1-phosphate transferase [Candidatus Gracilibacteria bacterium]|nr:undecaprenyl/decaprenyl-phosphate alpha-N-acetylglucosaminyl 1-phosphate transferase [Candidatus Gracilibacteria bacterium]
MLNIFILLSIFLSSVILSFLVINFVKSVFYKWNILDNPKKYGKKRDPIPYSMGIVLFISFFILSFLFIEPNSKLFIIWGFGLFITVVSFIDDIFKVSAKKRLIMQVLIGAVIGVTSIKIGYVSNIFGGILNLETYFITLFEMKVFIIPVIFTILWYVFIFNALNWTDGISGNTSGLSIISFFILFLLGYVLFLRDDYEGGIQNSIFIMQMTTILVGILIPFWFYDFREKILMGDSGTMFLGFMLATIAIISGGKIATVLVVFGIYVVDAIYVVIRRLLQGKSPLKGDLTHIHHRLLDLGLKRKEVLLLLYILSFLFGLTALFLDKFGKMLVFIIIVFVVIFINRIVDSLYLKRKKGKKRI